eukprot:694085_1
MKEETTMQTRNHARSRQHCRMIIYLPQNSGHRPCRMKKETTMQTRNHARPRQHCRMIIYLPQNSGHRPCRMKKETTMLATLADDQDEKSRAAVATLADDHTGILITKQRASTMPDEGGNNNADEKSRAATVVDHTWVSKPTRVSAFKSNDDGSRSLNVQNAWASTNRSMKIAGGLKVAGGIADTLIESTMTGPEERVSVSRVGEDGKLGSASIDLLGASAGIKKSDLGVKASAEAHVVQANATLKTGVPGQLFAPNASVKVLAANASADATVVGVAAKAEATVAEAQAGIKGTPLNVSASGPTAKAVAACRVDDVEASAGAYLAEATAGPFAVREGVKFGAGIKNYVPFVDLGPVSCLIM